MFSGVIPGSLALHSISWAHSLCLRQAAAGDSAPVSAASCPCPSVLKPAQAWEAAAAPAWTLFSVEEELGRAFPMLRSALMGNTIAVLIGSCQHSGEL